MTYLGELISIGVAFSWTATALLSEYGSKRLGNLTLNVLRMALALLFAMVLFGVMTGSILPPGASAKAAGWMLLSGLVGYVIGDFCLFQCYIIIRFTIRSAVSHRCYHLRFRRQSFLPRIKQKNKRIIYFLKNNLYLCPQNSIPPKA